MMIYRLLAGAAGFGLGTVAFRNEVKGRSGLLGITGLVLLSLVSLFLKELTDGARCILGVNANCGGMQSDATLTVWPTQATVADWTAKQMANYKIKEHWSHRWVIIQHEELGGVPATTQ